MAKKIKLVYLLLTLSVYLAILYFSLIPSQPIKPEIIYFDKFQHFFAYLLLSFLTYKTTKNKLLSFAIAGTYGLNIEIVQLFIPYRNFSFLDILMNYLGSAVILFIKQHKQNSP